MRDSVLLSSTTTPAAAPSAAEPPPAALPAIRSTVVAPLAAISAVPRARSVAPSSTRACVSVVRLSTAAEPARPAEPPTPKPRLVRRRSSCERALTLRFCPASTQALSPIQACVDFDSTPTSPAAPPPTDPPPPAPATTSNTVVSSAADTATLCVPGTAPLLSCIASPRYAWVCVFITLTMAAPPTATEPAPAAPTAKVLRFSEPAAATRVAPPTCACARSPTKARVSFSTVCTAAATPTPAEPPMATPLTTSKAVSVFFASIDRLPAVSCVGACAVDASTDACARFFAVSTLATPATPTLPPTAPLKPIRFTSCTFCASSRMPLAASTTAPAPMRLRVSLLLDTTALDTPTPTRPPSEAAAASEVAPVSLSATSATSPDVVTRAPVPMAASVLSVNTFTAADPAADTLSAAAPDTASV